MVNHHFTHHLPVSANIKPSLAAITVTSVNDHRPLLVHDLLGWLVAGWWYQRSPQTSKLGVPKMLDKGPAEIIKRKKKLENIE